MASADTRFLFPAFFCLGIAALVGACSSSTKKATPLRSGDIHRIHRIIPSNLHVRRTENPPADPQAGPGGEDYTSQPLPNARYDCEPAARLFEKTDLAGLNQCFKSLGAEKPITLTYRLKREPAPSLVLIENEDQPPCVKEKLPVIPVPREIFFQSNEEGPMNCYAARLNVTADEVLGSKVPRAKMALQLKFPMNESELEMKSLLLTWSLAPFWEEKDKHLSAKFVSKAICAACIGKKNLFDNLSPPQKYWPTEK